MHSSLQGPAQSYAGIDTKEIVESLRTRYDVKLRWDPNGSIFELSVNVGRLVGLAHPYVPVSERGQLVIDCLIDNVDDRDIQFHLLTADTSTVAKTVRAIEEYIAVRGSRRTGSLANSPN